MDTFAFLAEIYKYSDNNIYLWTMPGKQTSPFTVDQLGAMANAARKLTEKRQNVYFGVGTTAKRLAEYERPKNDEISGISAFWVDIDIADHAHAAQNLPPDIQTARALLPDNLEPSIVVYSGHGLHAYYLLREEWKLDTQEERQEATDLLRRLQGAVRQAAEVHGWHLDAVSDLTRVLRIPGTYNFKIPDAPVICEVIESSEPVTRYNVSDFNELPELSVTPPNISGAPRGGFERRATDGPSECMVQNCAFIQHVQIHADTVRYDEWIAMISNVIRATDGYEVVHQLSAIDAKRYDRGQTDKKIQSIFDDMQNPQGCQYIRDNLGFTGCPTTGCGVNAPCGWSLGKVSQAVAKIRTIAVPDAETVFTPETLGALALLEKNNTAEVAKFKEKCRGRVNINELNKALKTQRIKDSNLEVIDGGAAILQPGQKLGDVTTRQSVFDTPLDLAVPAGFAYGIDGITEIKKVGDATTRYAAAGAPVIISERIFNMDTKMEKVQLTFKYYDQWAQVIRKRSEVFSSRNIVALTDFGLNTSSESAKYLVKYLQALEAANPIAIPLKYAVSKIGWREHSLTDFIIPNVSDYRIDMEDEGEITEAFSIRGGFEEWKKTATRIRKEPFARFILAAAFAAPLLKVFKNRNFMIFFWGTSGGGKTASQVFSLSVWGSPGKLMKSFYGTQNGIEKALTFGNDFPMVINEKQVMNGKDKQDLFEQIVYMLEGGRGKLRASKTGLQKTSTWRTIGMASGEEPLSKENSIQGVKTRLLELNVYPVIADDVFAKSLYSFSEEHHGHAGPIFIERLIAEAADDYAEINAARNALISKLKEQFPEHFNVHVDNVALVAITDCLYSQWLFGIERAEAEQAAYEMACTVLAELPTERQISDVERGWDFVQTWLVANDGRFDKPLRELKITPSYGFIKDDFTCIYPEPFMKALQDAGFSPDKLLREFANKDRIETERDGEKRRFKIQVKYGGRKMRVVKIRNNPQEKLV